MTDTCQYCFSTDLDVQGGVLVCTTCGQQQQGFIEDADNAETQFQRGARTLSLATRTGPNQLRSVQTRLAEEHLSSLDDAGDMRAAVPLYLESLQHVLRCQTNTIATMFGLDTAPPGLGSLGAFVRRTTSHIWAMQLLRLGALESHVVSDAVEAFCSRQQTMLQSSVFGSTRQRTAPDANESDHPQPPKRASMDRIENAEAVLRAIVDGSELLITLIAALHVCRCAVTAHDVLRSAAEGVLPYLDTWPQVGPRVRDLQGGGLLQYAMRNASAPTLSDVSARLHTLCTATDLRLPPLHAPALLTRYAAELSLPALACQVALQLHTLLPGQALSWGASYAPYPAVVALLVVAMRLMYGLDGEPGPEGGCEEPHSWPAWAEGIVQRCARDNPGLLSVHELQAVPDGDVARLCAQLRANVFGGRQGPDMLASSLALLRALGEPEDSRDSVPHDEVAVLPAVDGTRALRGRLLRWDDGSRRARYLPGNAVAVHPDYLAVLVAAACLVGAQPAQVHEHVLVLEWGLVRANTALAE